MDPEFWHNKWEKMEIGFHEGQVNEHLKRFLPELKLPDRARIFLPLCGKTQDIPFLLGKGHTVKGVELSEKAVTQLFSEMDVVPTIEQRDPFKIYRADSIEIFVGDFFDMDASLLGPVDGIFDRAALVALPESMRSEYASKLKGITELAPQLLVAFDYDQSQLEGPPFSVPEKLVNQYYGLDYILEPLGRFEVEGGLKGVCKAFEEVWLLTPPEK